MSLSTGRGQGGDPLRFPGQSRDLQGQDSSWDSGHRVGPALGGARPARRGGVQAGLDPLAGLEEPQPQRPPQDPSLPSPEALASTAGTGDQQRPCSQSVSSLTPPKGIPALSPQTHGKLF